VEFAVSMLFQQQFTYTQLSTKLPFKSNPPFSSVWDTGIIERALKLYFSIPELFQMNIENDFLTKENIQAWLVCPSGLSKDCTTDWANESFLYAMNYAYQNEDNMEVKDGDHLTEDYFISRLDIVKRRLAAGGLRLASTLEDIFGADTSTSTSTRSEVLMLKEF